MRGKEKCTSALLVCLTLLGTGLLPQVAYADGDLAWARSAGGADRDIGADVDTDADGNALVTGYFSDSAVFGVGEANETTLDGSAATDIFVAKYAMDGTLVWARSAGGSSYDEAYGIALDPDGNTLVTGCFIGSATFGAGESNETTLHIDVGAPGSRGMFIAKYGPSGSLRWAKQAGGAGHDIGYQVTADALGNGLVTGYFSDIATFGAGEANETSLTAAGEGDIFVAKYTPTGLLEWATAAGSVVQDIGVSIAADAAGSALVTGYFGNGADRGTYSAVFGAGESNETILAAVGVEDLFVAKYAPDGTLVWVISAGGDSSEFGAGVRMDGAGTILITGSFAGSATFGAGEINETTLTSWGEDDIFLAWYAPDGTLVRATSAGGEMSDISSGIAVDAAGDAFVTGFFADIAVFAAGEASETGLTAVGLDDVFLAKYTGVPMVARPDLVIAKRAWPSPALMGKTLVYTLGIANEGPGDATGVVVVDRMPARARILWLPKTCSQVRPRTVRCVIGDLEAGAETELSIHVEPQRAWFLVNRARVESAQPDLNPADNSVRLVTLVKHFSGWR